MSAQIFYNNGSSSSEIITHLINSTDGAGLHFDGTSGTYVDCGDTTILDGATKISLEVIAATTGTVSAQLIAKNYSFGCFKFAFDAAGTISSYINNGSSSATATTSGTYNDGNPKHIVTTWDNATISIYINGNLDGTATLAGGSIPNTTDKLALGAQLNAAGLNGTVFDGTIYRARLWNKSLSQTDVTASYESASLDYADQWGSQTKVIDANFNSGYDGWNTANTWATQTNTASAMQLAASAADQYCRNSASFTAGKRYLVEYTATALTSTVVFSTHTGSVYADLHTITAGSNSFELVWPSGNGLVYIRSGTTTSAVTLDDVFITAIGCVSDYDLSYANPTQSVIVQNRSGSGDGTAAGGVTQITPIEQLNSRAIAVGTSAVTPADAQVHIKGADGAYGFIHEDATGVKTATYSNGSTGFIGTQSSHPLSLMVAGSGKVTISSAGNVGVGSGSLSLANLNITAAGGMGGGLLINRNATGFATSGQYLGSVGFKGTDSGNSNAAADASIVAKAMETHTGSTAGTNLEFYTKPTGTGPGSSPSLRLTIDSAGNSTFSGAVTATTAVVGSNTASGQVVKINGNGNSGDGAALAFQTVGVTKTQIGRQSGIIGGVSSNNLALYAAAGLGVNVYTGGNNLRLSIDSAGNVGVGVTPEAWQSSRTALQIGGNGSLNANASQAAGGHLDISQNAYINSSGTWSYISTDEASLYNQVGGGHTFKYAASGTADAAITWANALSIDNTGLATFSGNTTHGGAGGVETFYASGNTNGNSAIDIDVPCDDDSSWGTVFKVEASFTHCDCGYTCILDVWAATRSTSVVSYDEFRLDAATVGIWTVSKTSNTNFRVSKSAGTYGGNGPYWVKVTHRNA